MINFFTTDTQSFAIKQTQELQKKRFSASLTETIRKLLLANGNYEFNLAFAIYQLGRAIQPADYKVTSEGKTKQDKEAIAQKTEKFYQLCKQWAIREFGNGKGTAADFALFLGCLLEGVNIIRKKCGQELIAEKDLAGQIASGKGEESEPNKRLSDEEMQKIYQHFLKDEHYLAYFWGYILVASYVIASGVMAAAAFAHIFAGGTIVLPIIMFFFALYLAWATSKGIPTWLATVNSWWQAIKKLSAWKQLLLVVGFFAILSGGIAYGAIAYSSACTFLGLVGIGSSLCPIFAIMLFTGMTIAATVILMKGFWDLLEGNYLKTLKEYLSNIFGGKPLWKQVFLGIILLLGLGLAIWGLVATMDAGLGAIKEMLEKIPGLATKVSNIIGICIAVGGGVVGQLAFIIDTFLRCANFMIGAVKEAGKKACDSVIRKAVIFLLIIGASVGDAFLAARGILDSANRGKILTWVLASLAFTGQLIDSAIQPFIDGDENVCKAKVPVKVLTVKQFVAANDVSSEGSNSRQAKPGEEGGKVEKDVPGQDEDRTILSFRSLAFV